MKNFRKHHFLEVLKQFQNTHLPLDTLMHHYFRKNKAIGSKDRKEIAENIYGVVRWMGKLDAFLKKPATFEKRLEAFLEKKHLEPHQVPFIDVSFPKTLFALLESQYGLEKAKQLCLVLNEQAPVTLRTNLLQTTRQDLTTLLKKEGLEIELSKASKTAIHLKKRANLFGLDLFKKGWFELQDEGSQIICEWVKLPKEARLLDYCAASGGKTLAIASRLKNKGHFFLHDVRKNRLEEAKKRAKRAGVQNIHFQFGKAMEPLHKTMDVVICDVPCSGTGTLRRNPDLKWKFTKKELGNLVQKQKEILDQALLFLKPHGTLIYITCSILQEENQNQIENFLKRHKSFILTDELFLLPQSNGHDGFYAAQLASEEQG
jgi:16S rRNA (cytosine(967)-C(5))-methyltransferase